MNILGRHSRAVLGNFREKKARRAVQTCRYRTEAVEEKKCIACNVGRLQI